MHTITESTLQSLIANINHPAYGTWVTEQVIDLLAVGDLTPDQRACLESVLASRLETPDL